MSPDNGESTALCLIQLSVGGSTASTPSSTRGRRVSVDDPRIKDTRARTSLPIDLDLDSPAAGRKRFFFPHQPFDGADQQWWVPRFCSPEFENVYQRNQFELRRRRLRCAGAIISAVSLSLLLYLCVVYGSTSSLLLGPSLLLVAILSLSLLTFLKSFKKVEKLVLYCFVALLVGGGLAINAYSEQHMSLAGRFSIVSVVLVLLYSVLPLPVHHSLTFAVVYTITHEGLEKILARPTSTVYSLTLLVLCRLMLYLSIHLFLLHSSYMLEVLSRNTFWQLGHSLLYQHDLTFELELTERMINSMMPQRFSGRMLAGTSSYNSTGSTGDSTFSSPESWFKRLPRALFYEKASGKGTLASTSTSEGLGFRPMNLYKQDNVSILFADIVGFTQMSSNKSASDLVALLNNLFRRFDALALTTGCEKISTLGDCYYCVAGCPTACRDAADRCVRMGLAILTAIQDFCFETLENVDMRVGIHTGSVLCGIVGKSRIKFDVFSNDVRLANQLESSGVAGKVHISQATQNALIDKNCYAFEDGHVESRNPAMKGMKTYLLSNLVSTDPSSCPVSNAPSLFEFEVLPQRGIHLWEVVPHGPVTKVKSAPPDTEAHPSACRLDTPEGDAARVQSVPSQLNVIPPQEQLCDVAKVIERFAEVPIDTKLATESSCLSIPEPSERHFTLPASIPEPSERHFTLPASIPEPSERHFTVPASPAIHRSSIVAEMVGRQPMGKHSACSHNSHPVDMTADTLHNVILGGATAQMTRMVNIFEGCDSWLHRDSLGADDYHKWTTLSFKDPLLELRYRCQYAKDSGVEAWSTFDSPRFTVLMQVLLGVSFFLLSSLVVFLLFPVNNVEYPVTFSLSAILLAASALTATASAYPKLVSAKFHQFLRLAMGWYSLNALFLVLVFTPALCIVISVPSLCQIANFDTYDGTVFLFFLIQAALMQCLSFTHTHIFVKYLATCLIGATAIIIPMDGCGGMWHTCTNTTQPLERFGATGQLNNTAFVCQRLFSPSVKHEIIISAVLFICILNFLNREFEIGSRLRFRTTIMAQVKYCEIEDQKFQADLLLSNIVPDHVVSQLQMSSTYSENHDRVAVLFASITNFNDFYSESYEGGLECLRVLNELISDFDELMDLEEFNCVDKIKTIGATYMAASGLNPAKNCYRADKTCPVTGLMLFALRLVKLVDEFNENIIGFNFKLRIGFNYGPLTSGVVGTTKLLFDIWGDTVNVASRMESTCVEGFIQMPERCLEILSEEFHCKERPEPIPVKGKGLMKTVFVTNRRSPLDMTDSFLIAGCTDGPALVTSTI